MALSAKKYSAGYPASNTYFLIAFGLINALAYTLVLCFIGFLMGLTLSYWQFPLACVLSLATNHFFASGISGFSDKLQIFKISAGIVVLIIGLIYVSGLFYDVSFDGQ